MVVMGEGMQGSFNLFINNVELGLSNMVASSADDTQLFKMVKVQVDCEDL